MLSKISNKNILPEEIWKWQYYEHKVQDVMNQFNFKEIRTSLIQPTELLDKTLFHIEAKTDSTETEQMIFHIDKDKRYGLRTDGTISLFNTDIVNRAFTDVQRVYYHGPFFINKSTIEQNYQVGAEILGMEGSLSDIEIVALGMRIFKNLGMNGVKVLVNSFGCSACRPDYVEALKTFILENKNHYCNECVESIENSGEFCMSCTNPDCVKKSESAPKMIDYICQDCSTNFKEVKRFLSNLMLDYEIDLSLTGNFKYYNRTVFEFRIKSDDGFIKLGGGGRYDLLATHISGKSLSAIGFSLNTEKILDIMSKNHSFHKPLPRFKVLLYAKSKGLDITLVQLIQDFHENGIYTAINEKVVDDRTEEEYLYLEDCHAVVILEDSLLKNGKIRYKNLAKKVEENVYLQEIILVLDRQRKSLY